LEGLPGEEVGHEIVGILRANQDPETLTTWWRQMASRLTGIELTRWLGFGQHLGVLNQVPLQELAVVLDDPAERRNRALYILQSEQMKLFDQHPLAAEDAVDTVLRRPETIWWMPYRGGKHPLQLLQRSLGAVLEPRLGAMWFPMSDEQASTHDSGQS